ncbi:hypothetical protein [Jeotgalicoccus sp. WY2]|uniref:hypothetical protein n=1 Tax=Jeotgalicoccus sp. WY2 TaxID=2708346 RepID=UPI001BD6385C|nr:hypothetical protein [Jeotgalicoccus sp. WY2]
MDFIHLIAITKEDDKPQKLTLPLEFAANLNEQFKKFPGGVPIVTEERTITVKALIIATKSFWEEPFILIPNTELEDK